MDIYQSLNPFIRTAGNSICHAPWEVYERIILDWELLYIKEGAVRIRMEEHSFEAGSGSIILIKPGRRHAISLYECTKLQQPHIHFDLIAQEDSEQVKVNFKPKNAMTPPEIAMIRDDITAPGREMEMPELLTVSSLVEFEQHFFDVINAYTSREPFYQLQVKSKFLALWAYLLREVRINQKAGLTTVAQEYQQIKRYMDENYAHGITLEELSARFHISKFHLLRIFKQIYGVTPVHYARTVRMNKAKEYISFTSMSMTQIAQRLGFSSVNAFSRAFAKEEGVPPKFYRSGHAGTALYR